MLPAQQPRRYPAEAGSRQQRPGRVRGQPREPALVGGRSPRPQPALICVEVHALITAHPHPPELTAVTTTRSNLGTERTYITARLRSPATAFSIYACSWLPTVHLSYTSGVE